MSPPPTHTTGHAGPHPAVRSSVTKPIVQKEALQTSLLPKGEIEGIDVTGHRPRRVTQDELLAVKRVISMGCDPAELGVVPDRVEQWTDVPLVSQDPYGARDAIRFHIETLVAELRSGAEG